ncbi:hypothetical protein NLI96_g9673 [Meripilus lineatus]|uniref:Major facilitator superfamily (MFS) profile domain-containing protein n=1 Tax=Meripilus lineatus TaxID=2056292 RepID=A0AAD5UVA5_9APHY|nr:hypothetical protein NLI96_g9673 [Physisporinus lineatus]
MAETKAPALALKVSSGTLDVEKLGAEVIVSSTTDLSETPSIGNRVGDGNTDYLIHGKRLALLCVQRILPASGTSSDFLFDTVSNTECIYSDLKVGLMLLFGRILSIAPVKIIFLLSISIFELGSLFCAVAPSIEFLIFGRAIAGVGGAGLWISIMSVLAQITTIEQRPLIMGMFVAVFAVASVVGPLLGGVLSGASSINLAFLSSLTPRLLQTTSAGDGVSVSTVPTVGKSASSHVWGSLGINLPCGGLAILLVLLALPNIPAPAKSDKTTLQKWIGIDWIGAVLSLGMVTCLLLSLQWGGNERPWNDPSIIALLVLTGVLLVAFLAWEWKKGPDALMPIKMITTGDMPGACISTFFVSMGFVIIIYYFPLLYQIEGHSATRSGVLILPLMASWVAASAISGASIKKYGYVWPFLVIPPIAAAIASGFLYTVKPETRNAVLVGYQILLGFGLGAGFQSTLVLAQAEYETEPELVPLATSVVTFSQFVGLNVGLGIAGAVFSTELVKKLAFLGSIPQATIDAVRANVEIISTLPQELRDHVVRAFMGAIGCVLLVGAPAAALSIVGGLMVGRKKINVDNIGAM